MRRAQSRENREQGREGGLESERRVAALKKGRRCDVNKIKTKEIKRLSKSVW